MDPVFVGLKGSSYLKESCFSNTISQVSESLQHPSRFTDPIVHILLTPTQLIRDTLLFIFTGIQLLLLY